MDDLGSMQVGLGLNVSDLALGLDKAKGMLLGLSAVVATSLVGAGVAVEKLAGNFEQANTLLVTSAGETQKNLAMVSDGILKASVDTATSTENLQAAMFTIESSGQHGKAALLELTAAAEGAKVENADLTGVVQALSTTMHDWREPASQAVDVMNSFREAASIGTMRMDDFTGAMKNVGPVASLLSIPLTDIEAALSTMSLEGDKGAAAGTHLAQSLMNMLHPSSAAVSVLQEIGLTSQQVSDDLKKSLPDTLALITQDLAQKFPAGSAAYNAALATMFGGTRGLKSILELTGQNLQDFERDAAAIAPTMKANSTAVDGFAQVQQNFNFKLLQAKDAVEALGIKIGTVLLPYTGQLFDKVTPLIQHFSEWADKGNNLQGVLTTVGGVIRDDVIAPAERLYNAVEPIVTDFEKWNDKTHFLQNTLSDVGGFINIVASDVANNIIPPVRTLIGHFEEWEAKTNIVHTALSDLGTAIGITSTVLGTLVGWVSAVVGWFVQASPPAQIVLGLLLGIGAAVATIKFEEFALGIASWVTGLGSLSTLLRTVVINLLPNLAGALGMVATEAPVAATQLSLFSAAELGVGTASAGASTGILGMLGALAPVAAVVVGTTVAAEGLRQGLSNVVAQLLHIPPAAMPAKTEIFALGGTIQMLTTTTKTESHTQAEVYQQMLGNVHGYTTAATTLLQGFGREGVAIMQSMDASTELYWNNIAGYLANAQSALASYNASVAQDTYNAAHSGSGTGHMHAMGGTNLPAGVSYLAGEGGPEWINPAGSTDVHTARETAAMLAGGGGGFSGGYAGGGARQPVHIHLHLNGHEIGDALVEDTSALNTVSGAIVQTMRTRVGLRA